MIALLTEALDDAPWLARIKNVESETVKLVWLEEATTASGRQQERRMVDWEDTISRSCVILSGFRLNDSNKLDKNTVRLIQDTYASYFLHPIFT